MNYHFLLSEREPSFLFQLPQSFHEAVSDSFKGPPQTLRSPDKDLGPRFSIFFLAPIGNPANGQVIICVSISIVQLITLVSYLPNKRLPGPLFVVQKLEDHPEIPPPAPAPSPQSPHPSPPPSPPLCWPTSPPLSFGMLL